jgi:hypothetical protein
LPSKNHEYLDFVKVFPPTADDDYMVNSISSNLPNETHQPSASASAQKALPQSQAEPSKTGALSQDHVTLKSAGTANQNGNSK